MTDADSFVPGVTFVDLYFDGAYFVRLTFPEFPDTEMWYVVDSPTVRAGFSVRAGCIIGYSPRMKNAPQLGIGSETNDQEYGYTYIIQTWSYAPLSQDPRPELISEPNSRACDNPSGNSQCPLVRNPKFIDNFAGWDYLQHPAGGRSTPLVGRDGVELVGTFQQDLNLDPAQDYTITITYTALVARPREFYVQLGSTARHIVFDPDARIAVPKTTTIAAQSYTESSSDGLANWFTLSLDSFYNQDRADVIINFICVSAGLGSPAPTCLILNNEFEQGIDEWTVSGGPPPSFGGGLAFMYDTSYLAQSVTLNAKESADQVYTLKILARRAGAPTTGEHFDLTWTFGSDSGTLEWSDNVFQEKTGTITISSDLTDDLELLADATDSATSPTLHIDSICIVTADGVPPPGYSDPPFITASCKTCIYVPTGDLPTDFTEYVQWLGCVLTQALWDCQVKIILMGMWNLLTGILTFMGFFRLWLHSSMTNLALWTNSNIQVFAAYINGLVQNLTSQLLAGLAGVGGGGGGRHYF